MPDEVQQKEVKISQSITKQLLLLWDYNAKQAIVSLKIGFVGCKALAWDDMRSVPNAHDPAHGFLTHAKTMGSFVVAAFNETSNKTKLSKNFT